VAHDARRGDHLAIHGPLKLTLLTGAGNGDARKVLPNSAARPTTTTSTAHLDRERRFCGALSLRFIGLASGED